MAPYHTAHVASTTILVAVLVLLWGHVPSVRAVYEDRAGEVDWLRTHVGNVRHALFDPEPRSKMLYVGSEAAVVAALNTRTGATVWRRVLPEGETVDQMLLHRTDLFTLSGDGQHLRVWNTLDGSLLWDDIAYPQPDGDRLATPTLDTRPRSPRPSRFPHDAVLVAADDGPVVVVLHKGGVQARALSTGLVYWQHKLGKAVTYQRLAVVKDKILVVGVHTQQKAPAVMELSVASGTVEFEGILTDPSTPVLEASSTLALPSGGHHAVFVDETHANMVVVDLVSRATASITKRESLGVTLGLSLSPLRVRGGFVVESTGRTLLCGLNADGAPRLLREYMGGKTTLSPSVDTIGGPSVVVAATTTSQHTELEVVNLLDGVAVALPLCTDVEETKNGRVISVFVGVVKRTEQPTFKTLLISEDHSMTLVKEGWVLWTREEALASAFQVEFIDLPPNADMEEFHYQHQHQHSGFLLEAIVHRLSFHTSQIVSMATKIMSWIRQEASKDGTIPEEEKFRVDSFGFKKLILLLTSPGKLFALQTEKGQLVWSLYIPGLPSLAEFGQPWQTSMTTVRKMFLTRTSRNASPEVVVLGHSPPSTAASFLVWLDPLTGTENYLQGLPYTVNLATTLPYLDEEERNILVALDEDQSVHVFPDTPVARSLVHTNAGNIFLHHLDKDGLHVCGFGLEVPTEAREVGMVARALELWKLPIAAGGERITALGTQVGSESSYSPARVLGDRSILHKYLNPNLLAFGTEKTEGESTPVVTVYLLDTVSGKIHARVTHEDAKGPVRLVQSENFVVYSYFSEHTKSYEVSVMELYEDRADEWVPWLSSREGEVVESFDSFNSPIPRILSQAYVFPGAIRALGVTTTAKGITAKQILIGLASNRLLGVDRRLLDPRRPVGTPTAFDKEEGLVPYSPRLPVQPKSVLSYNQTIHRTRAIASSPTGLESTCMIFTYGLDLFFTHATPSMTYDQLGDEFNKVNVLATLVLLFVATGIASVVARRRELAKAWR